MILYKEREINGDWYYKLDENDEWIPFDKGMLRLKVQELKELLEKAEAKLNYETTKNKV